MIYIYIHINMHTHTYMYISGGAGLDSADRPWNRVAGSG